MAQNKLIRKSLTLKDLNNKIIFKTSKINSKYNINSNANLSIMNLIRMNWKKSKSRNNNQYLNNNNNIRLTKLLRLNLNQYINHSTKKVKKIR